MHELSLAESILQIAIQNTPADAILRSVRLRAGPRRAIDRDAMQNAWLAILQAQGQSLATLELQLDPWTFRCQSCGHQWQDEQLVAGCPVCINGVATPVDGNQLQVISIRVDEKV